MVSDSDDEVLAVCNRLLVLLAAVGREVRKVDLWEAETATVLAATRAKRTSLSAFSRLAILTGGEVPDLEQDAALDLDELRDATYELIELLADDPGPDVLLALASLTTAVQAATAHEQRG